MSVVIKNLKIQECLEILSNNFIGRLGYISDQSPNIVPITYFHDTEEKSIIGYSAEGHKIEAMRRNGLVALQVDEITSIQEWRSILIHGTYIELEGVSAAHHLHRFAQGVQNTIVKNGGVTPKFIQDFSSRLQGKSLPIVYRISIAEISGKYRNS